MLLQWFSALIRIAWVQVFLNCFDRSYLVVWVWWAKQFTHQFRYSHSGSHFVWSLSFYKAYFVTVMVYLLRLVAYFNTLELFHILTRKLILQSLSHILSSIMKCDLWNLYSPWPQHTKLSQWTYSWSLPKAKTDAGLLAAFAHV